MALTLSHAHIRTHTHTPKVGVILRNSPSFKKLGIGQDWVLSG